MQINESGILPSNSIANMVFGRGVDRNGAVSRAAGLTQSEESCRSTIGNDLDLARNPSSIHRIKVNVTAVPNSGRPRGYANKLVDWAKEYGGGSWENLALQTLHGHALVTFTNDQSKDILATVSYPNRDRIVGTPYQYEKAHTVSFYITAQRYDHFRLWYSSQNFAYIDSGLAHLEELRKIVRQSIERELDIRSEQDIQALKIWLKSQCSDPRSIDEYVKANPPPSHAPISDIVFVELAKNRKLSEAIRNIEERSRVPLDPDRKSLLDKQELRLESLRNILAIGEYDSAVQPLVDLADRWLKSPAFLALRRTACLLIRGELEKLTDGDRVQLASELGDVSGDGLNDAILGALSHNFRGGESYHDFVTSELDKLWRNSPRLNRIGSTIDDQEDSAENDATKVGDRFTRTASKESFAIFCKIAREFLETQAEIERRNTRYGAEFDIYGYHGLACVDVVTIVLREVLDQPHFYESRLAPRIPYEVTRLTKVAIEEKTKSDVPFYYWFPSDLFD